MADESRGVAVRQPGVVAEPGGHRQRTVVGPCPGGVQPGDRQRDLCAVPLEMSEAFDHIVKRHDLFETTVHRHS